MNVRFGLGLDLGRTKSGHGIGLGLERTGLGLVTTGLDSKTGFRYIYQTGSSVSYAGMHAPEFPAATNDIAAR